jgi:hypothetical protein
MAIRVFGARRHQQMFDRTEPRREAALPLGKPITLPATLASTGHGG